MRNIKIEVGFHSWLSS